MVRIASYVIAAAIIIGTGILHGNGTGRWGAAEALKKAAARLDNVPMQIGDWQGHDAEVDPEEVAKAQAVRILSRNFINEKTRQTISVLIVCGRPGPVSVHTPDICFQGAGRIMMNNIPELVTLPLDGGDGPRSASFFTADFHRPNDVDRQQTRVYWSWSADGEWQAPEHPRTTFFWDNKLYKMYIVRPVSPVEKLEPGELDPSLQFAELLIPALDQALFEDAPAADTDKPDDKE